jgi:hypothetical protein
MDLAILMYWIDILAFFAITGKAIAALLKWLIYGKQCHLLLLEISYGPQLTMHNICLGAVV